jgi:hypothetical protein
MTHHTPAHPARQHWLSVGGSNYSDKDHFPDMGTVQLWKKNKLNSEMTWKRWKKGKSNRDKIRKI